ncbi:hypothetical protein ScalyP_jg524 [Parmales sp. scaly parma]|nr:hypothetical protein ScalyP_jg524 [Parmales sp. scaly parma]
MVILCWIIFASTTLLTRVTGFTNVRWFHSPPSSKFSNSGNAEEGDVDFASTRSKLESLFDDSHVSDDKIIAQEFLTLVKKMKREALTQEESKTIYEQLKRRVLDTPAALSEFLSRAKGIDLDLSEFLQNLPQEPSPSLTPSEVVIAVLDALKANEASSSNNGFKVLSKFTSSASSLEGATDDDLIAYVQGSKYKILCNWNDRVFAKKIEMSANRKKAYLTVRLQSLTEAKWHSCSFVLSESAIEKHWLVDSFLVKN